MQSCLIIASYVTICVQGELDELEREEFFRLKKVQNKKQQKDSAPQQVTFHTQKKFPLYHMLEPGI